MINDKGHKVFRSFVMVSQVGISMMVPIFICAALGVWINRLTGTQIWFVIMLFLGIGAAFRNLYIITKSFYSADMKKEHERLKYVQELKDYRKDHSDEFCDSDVLEGKKKRYPENRGETRS